MNKHLKIKKEWLGKCVSSSMESRGKGEMKEWEIGIGWSNQQWVWITNDFPKTQILVDPSNPVTVRLWGQGRVEALNRRIRSFKEYLYMPTMMLGVGDTEVKRGNHMGHPSGNSEKTYTYKNNRKRERELGQQNLCHCYHYDSHLVRCLREGSLRKLQLDKSLHICGRSPVLNPLSTSPPHPPTAASKYSAVSC